MRCHDSCSLAMNLTGRISLQCNALPGSIAGDLRSAGFEPHSCLRIHTILFGAVSPNLRKAAITKVVSQRTKNYSPSSIFRFLALSLSSESRLLQPFFDGPVNFLHLPVMLSFCKISCLDSDVFHFLMVSNLVIYGCGRRGVVVRYQSYNSSSAILLSL